VSRSSSSLSNSTSGTLTSRPPVNFNGLSGGLVIISSDSDDDLPNVSMKSGPSNAAAVSRADAVAYTVKTENGLTYSKSGEERKKDKHESKVRLFEKCIWYLFIFLHVLIFLTD